MKCKNCGNVLNSSSKFCSVCGEQVESSVKSRSKIGYKVAILIVVLILLGTGGYYITTLNSSPNITVTKENKNQSNATEKKDDVENTFTAKKDIVENETTKIYEEKAPAVKSSNITNNDKLNLEKTVNSYVSNFENVANYYDISYISQYMQENSSIYNKQKSLIESYEKKNIKVELKNHEILEIKKEDYKYSIKVKENFKIHKNGEVKTSEYTATYKAVLDNGNWYLTDITTS